MRRLLQTIGFTLLLLILTLFTQVGGVIALCCMPVGRMIRKKIALPWKRRIVSLATYLGVYLIFTLFIIPPLAKVGGRVPLPLFGEESLKPLNIGTYFLNRQYVTPALYQLLLESSRDMDKISPGSIIAYMDASHPFGNGYPLIPHLSHNDGRKVDVAFFYKSSQDQKPVHRKAPTWIGYGGCEVPKQGEFDQPADCASKGYWQYNILYQLSPPWAGRKLIFDPQRTKAYLDILARKRATGKIFIEPHLKSRLGLSGYNKIRFHGCHAVRHDDHIHLQL